MNEIKRKIKELRKTQKPVCEVKIQVFADNRVEVMGLPNNYHAAMEVMTGGLRRVVNHFVTLAKDGQLDDKMNITKNPIVPIKTPILGPDGKRLQ